MGGLYGGRNNVEDVAAIIRSLLRDEIGTFQNSKPAIWVEAPQAPTSGTGVHVYIQRYPQIVSDSLYQWNISFILHGEDLEKFDKAVAKMRLRFPRRKEVILPYREGLLTQANFSLIFERFAYSNY